MPNKTIVRLCSGVAALLLGISLTSCRGGKIDKETEITNRPSYESIDPDSLISTPAETYLEQPTESAASEEIQEYNAYRIERVIFTDPTTGLKRCLLMDIEEAWPKLDANSAEAENNFITQIFGKTELAPYIDQSFNKAVVMRYRSITDPSISVEVQVATCKDEDSETKTINSYGYYNRNTVYIDGMEIESLEMYVEIEGESKRYIDTTTLYDETGMPCEYETEIPIIVKNLIFDPRIDVEDILTEEEIIELENGMNEHINDAKTF